MRDAQHAAVAAISRRPDGTERHPQLLAQFARQAGLANAFLSDREVHLTAKREHHRAVLTAIESGRAELIRMNREGDIHDDVLRSLEHELDLQQLVAESHLG